MRATPPRLVLLALLVAVPTVASAQTPAASAEAVDLLDFDQGTVLVSAPPSYGEGVSAWSPFSFSDGNKDAGWCSADGHPNDNEFVYELAQDAEPRTLRVSTAGVQEDGYPGISARAVELWGAAANGAFARLGALEVPKGGVKELALPAGTTVRRVKVVVKSNWGNAQYTEVAEVDLLGRKVGTLPPVDVSGEYHSSQWNGLRMKQTGTRVDGCYDYAEGRFSGEVDGNVAKVTWSEDVGGGQRRKGTATFVVAPDKSSVRGIYFHEGEETVAGTWDLDRPSTPEERPRCTPQVHSLAQALSSGRVVLYGIHFDTGSDVPRPDSDPTLQQILQVLQQDASLKLQVEGHTDATNTDAFNQALSERRAAAVVAWLTAKGIAPQRLVAKGFGRTRPIAGNGTAQGRALNRRVELVRLAS